MVETYHLCSVLGSYLESQYPSLLVERLYLLGWYNGVVGGLWDEEIVVLIETNRNGVLACSRPEQRDGDIASGVDAEAQGR